MTTLATSAGIFAINWRRVWTERVSVAVPVLTYALLVAVFASIFGATPLAELPDALRVSAPELIWYLIFTEMVTFIGGPAFPEARGDMLDGQFAASLQRPLSYFRIRLIGWAGQNAARAVVFMAAGITLGLLFAGNPPAGWERVACAALSAYLGSIMYSVVYFTLATLETWGPYARPAMWISQKFCFLLGGLLLPIRLYPHWVQIIAWCTPYPALLYIPGRLAFGPDAGTIAAGLLIQLFWLCALTGFGFFMQHKAYRTILDRGY